MQWCDAQGNFIVEHFTEPIGKPYLQCQYMTDKPQDAKACKRDSDCKNTESCRPVPYGILGTLDMCVTNGKSPMNFTS